MDPLATGEHCTVRDCKQFDFLPFTCDRCQKVFCLSHRRYVDHDCTGGFDRGSVDRIVLVCPICAQSFPLDPNVDPNECFHRHQASGSCNPDNYSKVHKKPRCPVQGCKEQLKLSNKFECADCGMTVCLKHRFKEDHDCRPKSSGFQISRFLGTSRSQSISSSRNQKSIQANRTSQQQKQTRPRIQKETCPTCGVEFSSVNDLIKHVDKKHGAGSGKSVGSKRDGCVIS